MLDQPQVQRWTDTAVPGQLRLPVDEVLPLPGGSLQRPVPDQQLLAEQGPISGQGFSAHFTVLNLDNQLASALACFDTATCPHRDYQNGQIGADAVESGAGFVVQHLAGLP
jgi:hypothetical protein